MKLRARGAKVHSVSTDSQDSKKRRIEATRDDQEHQSESSRRARVSRSARTPRENKRGHEDSDGDSRKARLRKTSLRKRRTGNSCNFQSGEITDILSKHTLKTMEHGPEVSNDNSSGKKKSQRTRLRKLSSESTSKAGSTKQRKENSASEEIDTLKHLKLKEPERPVSPLQVRGRKRQRQSVDLPKSNTESQRRRGALPRATKRSRRSPTKSRSQSTGDEDVTTRARGKDYCISGWTPTTPGTSPVRNSVRISKRREKILRLGSVKSCNTFQDQENVLQQQEKIPLSVSKRRQRAPLQSLSNAQLKHCPIRSSGIVADKDLQIHKRKKKQCQETRVVRSLRSTPSQKAHDVLIKHDEPVCSNLRNSRSTPNLSGRDLSDNHGTISRQCNNISSRQDDQGAGSKSKSRKARSKLSWNANNPNLLLETDCKRPQAQSPLTRKAKTSYEATTADAKRITLRPRNKRLDNESAQATLGTQAQEEKSLLSNGKSPRTRSQQKSKQGIVDASLPSQKCLPCTKSPCKYSRSNTASKKKSSPAREVNTDQQVIQRAGREKIQAKISLNQLGADKHDNSSKSGLAETASASIARNKKQARSRNSKILKAQDRANSSQAKMRSTEALHGGLHPIGDDEELRAKQQRSTRRKIDSLSVPSVKESLSLTKESRLSVSKASCEKQNRLKASLVEGKKIGHSRKDRKQRSVSTTTMIQSHSNSGQPITFDTGSVGKRLRCGARSAPSSGDSLNKSLAKKVSSEPKWVSEAVRATASALSRRSSALTSSRVRTYSKRHALDDVYLAVLDDLYESTATQRSRGRRSISSRLSLHGSEW